MLLAPQLQLFTYFTPTNTHFEGCEFCIIFEKGRRKKKRNENGTRMVIKIRFS